MCIWVPFSPEMPGTGLDYSWRFALNQAVAQGLIFGRDIIFTFGPYSSIYTTSYHPATHLMMMVGSIYLSLLYSLCLICLAQKSGWRWTLCFLMGYIGMYSRDSLLFQLPLLVGMTSIFFLQEIRLSSHCSKKQYIKLFVLWNSFGLLPLIKGTLLFLCAAIGWVCFLFMLHHQKKFFWKSVAWIFLISPILAMIFFWVAAGQSSVDLYPYLMSIGLMTAGYTEAMDLYGPPGEIVLYLMTSSFLCGAILFYQKIDRWFKWFLVSSLTLYLFLAFKSGFVRHDTHSIQAGIAILTAATLLQCLLPSKRMLFGMIFALISFCSIVGHSVPLSVKNIVQNFVIFSRSSWNGLEQRIKDPHGVHTQFDEALRSIRLQADFQIFQGKTDTYSYHQSYLIASGNTWSPRPIFQGYAAYTPRLVEKNKQYFFSQNAPNTIIFRIETIDGRFPSLDEGWSWPILLTHYKPIKKMGDFLFLRKGEGLKIARFKDQLVHSLSCTHKSLPEKHLLGERVQLSSSILYLFAQIKVKPTLLGRIASFLFKTSPLQIQIELKNGIKKKYRIVAGMMPSGFLLSPLIENTDEFRKMYQLRDHLAQKEVQAFVILPRYHQIKLWEDEYTLVLSSNAVLSE